MRREIERECVRSLSLSLSLCRCLCLSDLLKPPGSATMVSSFLQTSKTVLPDEREKERERARARDKKE